MLSPRAMWLGFITSFAAPALAGSGPWVLAQGEHQIFLSANAQHFRNFALGDGPYAADTLNVSEGISSIGLVGIASVGLGGRFEAELEFPWYTVFGHQPDNDVCQLIGQQACVQTQGVGIIRVGTKAQILDELYGAPLSLSLGLDLRFGQLTAKRRERVTNLGEGTFDIEPRLAIGRVGSLGGKGGYWTLLGDLGVRYRIPMATEYAGYDAPIPGLEITFYQATLFTPVTPFSIGPTFSLLSRPQGLDFGELDLSGRDRFSALNLLSMRVGLKAFVRGADRVTFTLGVERTVYAENNPSDVVAFNAGVALRDVFRRRER